MKQRHLSLGVALLFSFVIAGANVSWSACSVPRAITSSTGVTLDSTSYVYTPGVDPLTSPSGLSVTAAFDGAFWSLGDGDPQVGIGRDSGSWPAIVSTPTVGADWVRSYPEYPVFIAGNWASSSLIDGCIDNSPAPRCVAILLEDQVGETGYMVLLSSLADSSSNYTFVQPGGGPIDLAEIPQAPLLNSMQSAPGVVTVNLGAPDVSAGSYLECGNEHAGYQIYSQSAARGSASPADPLIETGGWTALGDPVPNGQPSQLDLDCSSGDDIFLATQLLFDSGYSTKRVSGSIRISCGPCPGVDADGDSFCSDDELLADCNDADPSSYPGAPQLCDGVNNDCMDPNWPLVPANELDTDGDLLSACQGDCNDDDPEVSAAASERCNGTDDDCDGLVDELNGFVDLDQDGITGACDNCPSDYNPSQDNVCDAEICEDVDGDGENDSTDSCLATPVGASVDSAGCSIAEFCAQNNSIPYLGRLTCLLSDWNNDEPLMGFGARDCRVSYQFNGTEEGLSRPNGVGGAFGEADNSGTAWGGWSCVPR